MQDEKVAYKLFRLKNGRLYPLFINRSQETEIGKWLKSECIPTKGFCVRQGWHSCILPVAPHLKEVLSSGEKRVWVECIVRDYVEYQRPESQGGTWILADLIKINRILSNKEVEDARLTGIC